MPAQTPDPYRCRDFTSFHLGAARFISAHISDDNTAWQVLYHGPLFQHLICAHATREAAETDAHFLATLLLEGFITAQSLRAVLRARVTA